MGSSLALFESDGWSVRAIDHHGEPWFVAADVAKALGLSNTTMAVDPLDDDEKGVSTVETLGGAQRVVIVSESGLYSLILRSRKREAKAFKRWVTHEVLPAIRRTGSYAVAEPVPQFEIPQTYAAALKVAAEQAERAERAEEALAVAGPKIEAYEAFMDADGCLSMDATAKALSDVLHGKGRNTLFARLREMKILQPNNMPYQRYKRYFEVTLGTHVERGLEVPHATTRVRPEGVEWLRRRLGRQYAQLELEGPDEYGNGVSFGVAPPDVVDMPYQ